MNTTPSPIRIGVLGAGTVGAHVIHLLQQWADEYERRLGTRLEVQSVLVRRLDAKRAFPIDSSLLTTDPYEVIAGKDLVVELIGGVDPAYEYVMTALKNGSAVITGNKALIASRGPELFAAAREANTRLYFEAAVAGAIPVIGALTSSLRGDRVRQIAGVVNGTTNFILDQMTTQGADYGEALAQAQELGFAEADPSADVEGYDASAKCAIMSSLSFGRWVSVESVPRQGITALSTDDIELAGRLGYVIVAAACDRLNGLGAMREEDELPVKLSDNWSIVSPFIIRLSVPTTSSVSESVSRLCSSLEVSLQGIDIEAGDTEEESVVTLTTQAIARDRAHGLVEALVNELNAHVPPAIFPLLDI